MAHIVMDHQLPDAIRAAVATNGYMRIIPEAIAQQVMRENTFGGSLRRTSQASVRLVVTAMYPEPEDDEGGNYTALLERLDDWLERLEEVPDILPDIAQLSADDRAKFALLVAEDGARIRAILDHLSTQADPEREAAQ
jgi:hypothetical protein